jgi:small subunit ribosomal protein S27Ae
MSRKREEAEVEADEAEEPEELEEEEVVERKVKAKKPKPEKKKTERKIFRNYKISDEGLTRLRPFCERCGPGYFMADHGNRYACGHCGLTLYKQNEQ